MALRSLLLTGSRGFVGRHLRVTLGRALPDVLVHEARFDMTDLAGIRAELIDFKPDACIHLAAVSAIQAARQEPDLAWRVNLGGTLELARAIMELVPECRLLFASSADAYGRSFMGGAALDESAALAPMNTYAATKAAADLAIGALAADGLHAIRLRLFNHTGAGQSEAFVVAAFARQIARIEAGLQAPELHVGRLDPARDFLDVADVCEAYVACLRRLDDLAADTVLNVASGTARRIGDILDGLLRLSGVKARVLQDPGRLRPGDISMALGDAGLARRLVGWQPRVPWERTLGDVLGDWRLRVG